MNKRTLSAALALLLLMSSLSCGKESDAEMPAPSDSGTTAVPAATSPVETEDPLAEPVLPAKTYDGADFNILTRIEAYGIYNNEHLVVEEENGEILNDAIHRRNLRVEEKLGLNLVEILDKVSYTMKEEIIHTVMSDSSDYDLIVPTPIPAMGTDYLLDFRTMEHLNLDKPWYNQGYIEAMSVNHKLTSLVSSAMITQMDSALGMFYNKKLATDFHLPDLYALVRDGAWTLDKFFEITAGVTNDTNGDSVYDDRDRYAFVGLDGMGRLAAGVEINYIVKNSDDLPVLNTSDAAVIDTITTIADFGAQYERDIYNPRKEANTSAKGAAVIFDMFLNDQALFFVHGIGSAQMFRDMESDFGILPTPKLNETQETYAVSPDATKCMVVPKTVSDPERVALVLEYMSWTGYTDLRPSYYDSMLQSKYMRDNESIEMMDEYIYPNIGFQPSGASATLIAAVNEVIISGGEIASSLASIQKIVAHEIKSFIKNYTDEE